MPDNSEEIPLAGLNGAQTRRNWWYRAKEFIVSNCGMYETGDHANFHISNTRIKAQMVVIENHPGTYGEVQGHNYCWGNALISAPQQNYPGRSSTHMAHDSRRSEEEHGCPPIPMLHDGHRSGEGTLQDIPVQEPLPGFLFFSRLYLSDSLNGSAPQQVSSTDVRYLLSLFLCRSHILLFQHERNVSEPHATAIYADPDPPSHDSVSVVYILIILQFTCCIDRDCNCGLLGCSYRHRYRCPNSGSNIHP